MNGLTTATARVSMFPCFGGKGDVRMRGRLDWLHEKRTTKQCQMFLRSSALLWLICLDLT